MQNVEFYATIDNGKIDIPIQYRDEFQSEVKVILLKTVNKTPLQMMNNRRVARGFGALAHRANPNLREKEKGAWERAVIDKYDSN